MICGKARFLESVWVLTFCEELFSGRRSIRTNFGRFLFCCLVCVKRETCKTDIVWTCWHACVASVVDFGFWFIWIFAW